jgi:syntaxin 18
LQNSHIFSLDDYLKSIRKSYLSASQPPRRAQLSRADSYNKGQASEQRQYFTDAQRDQIDAESKQLLRGLNGAIHNLSDAETLRQNTESTLSRRKFGQNGLGALGRWAAGGIGPEKSKDEELEEARANGVKAHRESVLWYLRRKLEACGEVQRAMMETRLTREVEKSKSILYKTRGPNGAIQESTTFPRGSESINPRKYKDARGLQMDDQEEKNIEQLLSPEQLQLFAQENQDMLKHYEDTLDQVRYVCENLFSSAWFVLAKLTYRPALLSGL